MAACGIREREIGLVIGISEPTLRLYFRHELDIGLIEANTKVDASLFATALKGGREGTDAAKFWLRCRAGWSEYAPLRHERPERLGKKAQAALDAETADEGTE